MNRIIFILMLLPAGDALAQNTTIQAIQSDTAKPRQRLLALKNASLWLSRAKLSHTTDKGKVYIMPIDNMPCLVPDVKRSAPMPTIRPVPDKRMPNPFRTSPVIPKGR
jgi:hypothetical protein